MGHEKIIIDINGNTNNLDSNIKKSQTKLEKLKSVTRSVGSSIGSAAKIGAIGFAALTAAAGKAVSMFREQEQVEIRTRKTIEATGGAAGLTAKEIFNMASELQGVTTYGDEAIISGQNLLLTFRNIGKDTFPRATEAMLDMSTAMGTDIKSSAIQLGKALNDPVAGISALTRVGITFTNEQKAMIKSMAKSGNTAKAQSIILAELENQFGGVSRAATEGTGAFIQTKNIMGDVVEEVGRGLMPAFTAINKKVKEMLPSIGVLAKKFGTLVKAFVGLSDKDKSIIELNDKIKDTEKEISRLTELSANLSNKGFFAKIFDPRKPEEINKVIDQQKAKLVELKAKLDATVFSSDNADSKTKDAINARVAAKKEETVILTEAQRKQNEEIAKINEEARIAEEEVKLNMLNDKILQAELDQELLATNLSKEQQIRFQAQLNIEKGEKKHEKIMAKARAKNAKVTLANQRSVNTQMIALEQQKNAAILSGATMLGGAMIAASGKSMKQQFMMQKALAIASATISAYMASNLALANPPGPPWTIPVAAAALTNGLINVGFIAATGLVQMSAMKEGGLVTGGIPNKDSVPTMLTAGELVVPKENFEDVVNSYKQEDNQKVDVTITMNENLVDFIEAELNERSALNV